MKRILLDFTFCQTFNEVVAGFWSTKVKHCVQEERNNTANICL